MINDNGHFHKNNMNYLIHNVSSLVCKACLLFNFQSKVIKYIYISINEKLYQYSKHYPSSMLLLEKLHSIKTNYSLWILYISNSIDKFQIIVVTKNRTTE